MGHLWRTCPLLLVDHSTSSLEGSPVVREPSVSYAPVHPKFGIYSHSLSLFDDVSDSMLDDLDGMVNAPPPTDLVFSASAPVDAPALLPSPVLVSSNLLSSPSVVTSFELGPSLSSLVTPNPHPSPTVPSFSSLVDFPPLHTRLPPSITALLLPPLSLILLFKNPCLFL